VVGKADRSGLGEAALLFEAEKRFGASRRRKSSLGRFPLEAVLHDGEGIGPGGAQPCRFRDIGAAARRRPARDLLHQSKHVPEREEPAGGTSLNGGVGDPVLRHGPHAYRTAAKEALTAVAGHAPLRQGGGSHPKDCFMNALAAALALPFLLVAAPAMAQEEEVPADQAGTGIGLDGEITLLSDYRYRGISRSDEDPALQAQATVSVGNGLYVGARGTTLSGLDNFRIRDPQFEDLGEVQLDLYAGYTKPLSLGTSLDFGLIYYVFPSGEGKTDYFEPYASLSHTLGPVEATVGAKYAPKQAAIGDEDILYLFGEVEARIPLMPITLVAQAGRQDAGGLGRYWNWSLGARYAIGPVEAGLRYVDTDLEPLPGQDGGLVLSLGFRF
jgi:uncharacterized protein (TIGR02001 family)